MKPLGARARPTPCAWAPLRLGFVLVLGGLLALGPATAQDKPTLKDVLGRVQSERESKAVEDLVGKLKGVPRKEGPSATPAPDPASQPGSAAGPAPADPPMQAPADGGAAPTRPPAATPPKVALPTKPSPAAKPAETKQPSLRPDEAVRRAETKDAPSVDLEVFFEYDSAQITPKSVAVLDTLGRALSDARLAEDAFLIAGHTDAKGAADYNLALSQRRAESVRQYLISKFRIDASKLVAKGYASQHLKNAGAPLAAENRRVQIVNLSKDQR
jgi:outer membrane protein OmpA-like peptidoglycan-associated protein